MSLSAQDLLTRRLQANLNAIVRVDPALAERICWPADDSHTRFDENGALLYRFHRNWFEVEPSAEVVEQLTASCQGNDTIFLAGTGLGNQLIALLERFPNSSIVAWERDPWLLRLCLMQRDYSQLILSGRLRFCLGADLLAEPDILSHAELVEHHSLSAIYHREIELLKTAPHAKIALLR